MSLPSISSIKTGNTLDLETLMTILTNTIGTYDFALYPNNDGWIAETNTWTYSSATANSGVFTISGDHTSRLTKGMKVKYTQTTLKFGVITSVSYSSPNTSVAITGGTDYVLANAAISSPYYSYGDRPALFPNLFADTSLTPTGFSAQGTYYNRFMTTGTICHLWHHYTALGTSNSTSYGVPLPITASSNLISYLGHGTGTDNTSTYQNNVLATISAGGSSMALTTNGGAANWTSSGTKGATIYICYPF